tara:strand:- start:857 stop:1861 length:1005 start_codon:yes stop_codon:yes gene_type:complete
MNQTQWDAFRGNNIEGGQLILGYSGKESALNQIGTWNIDSVPIDFDQKHIDKMRFFSYDLNNDVTIPMEIAPYGVVITDSGTSNEADTWDSAKNRVLPQAALKVQGNGAYQIELESYNNNILESHAMFGKKCKGGIGIDNNGFMRIVGDGDETLIDENGNGGHYSGVGILAFTKEVARFTQDKIEFHVPVESSVTPQVKAGATLTFRRVQTNLQAPESNSFEDIKTIDDTSEEYILGGNPDGDDEDDTPDPVYSTTLTTDYKIGFASVTQSGNSAKLTFNDPVADANKIIVNVTKQSSIAWIPYITTYDTNSVTVAFPGSSGAWTFKIHVSVFY